MGIEERRQAVRRYVADVLDGGRPEVLRELCTPDFVQRFPGITVAGLENAVAGLARISTVYSSFKTTLHAVVAEGDRVAAHLSHDVVVRDGIRTRLGTYPAPGQAIHWDAIAMFRFEGDRVAEEWIARDDLGVLLQLGAVGPG